MTNSFSSSPYVSRAAGEDVVAATYTPEELALIEESLKN